MSNAQEAVKPAHGDFAYFPGSGAGSVIPVETARLPVVIAIFLRLLVF